MTIVLILMGAIIHFGIGMLWYTKLFGEMWAKESNMSMDEKPTPMHMIQGFGVSFLTTSGIYYIVSGFGATALMAGACIGFFTWLTLIVAPQYSGVIWAGKSIKLFLIEVGCQGVNLIVLGSLFAAIL